jgi:acetyl esterase
VNTTPLDPGMASFAKLLAAQMPAGFESWPLAKQREVWNDVCKAFRAPYPADLTVEDITCNGVSCRIYRPEHLNQSPTVIYGHGGGWVLGSFETHGDMCAELAAAAQCAVVLMDYRLAPEHPFPAQLEDSLKVWRWLRQQGSNHGLDASNIIAAGDSAGGQMSASLALALAELGLPQVQGLLLIYPVLGADVLTDSYQRNATSKMLSKDEMLYYLRSFLGPEDHANWHNPKALPNLAPDVSFLPPTVITVAGHDPICDDGLIFRNKLQSAGVPVAIRQEPALGHSYMRARHHSEPAKKGFDWIAKALKVLLQGGGESGFREL